MLQIKAFFKNSILVNKYTVPRVLQCDRLDVTKCLFFLEGDLFLMQKLWNCNLQDS